MRRQRPRVNLENEYADVVDRRFLPLLPAELFSGLLTMASAYVSVALGELGLGLFGLVLVLFQYLIGELLKSKHRSDELRRRATTDELTGLANRERFRSAVESQIATAAQTGGGFGVMLLDLDRFKEINDTLGHHYGDELLRELGPRVAAAIGPDGLVARLGGDEFAILAATRAPRRRRYAGSPNARPTAGSLHAAEAIL